MEAEAAGFAVGALSIVLFGFAIGVAFFLFWIWMVIDCATKEPSEGNDKIIWILVIIFLNWLGALIYFFARRPTRIRMHGR
jgi:uncharacterized membrane-anchored protein